MFVLSVCIVMPSAPLLARMHVHVSSRLTVQQLCCITIYSLVLLLPSPHFVWSFHFFTPFPLFLFKYSNLFFSMKFIQPTLLPLLSRDSLRTSYMGAPPSLGFNECNNAALFLDTLWLLQKWIASRRNTVRCSLIHRLRIDRRNNLKVLCAR